ncbi:MAG: T9SS type A sorting domain-containing protein [Cytophagales bacterium]|nr:T9SS type A sorting domain-containing protein [Cytophagales bacterium]
MGQCELWAYRHLATWAVVEIAANLVVGSNTVRLTANTSSGGPNIDNLDLCTNPGARQAASVESLPDSVLPGIEVYPNPISQGLLNIQLHGMGSEGQVELSIYDLNGLEIYQTDISLSQAEVSQLDVAELGGSGMYLIKVNTPGHNYTSKLLVY